MSFPPQFDTPISVYQRPTILLVEDDSATRELFDYALRLSGLAVVAARDGLAGLRAIEQQVPDAVVLDLDLPNVSGIDVHQEIVSHAETRDIPIIIVTGTSWRAPAGVFRTLRKPITSDVLVTVVQQALRQHDDQAANRIAHTGTRDD
jgi:CheY-like chemotaxis protein